MLGACGCRLCPCPLARAWPVARIPAASRARRIPKRRPFRRRRTARRACQHHGTACPPLGCRRGPRFQSEPTCRQCSGTPETACAPASRARDRNRSLAWARNPSPCTTSPPTISRAKSRLGNRAPRLNFPRCHQLIHRKPPPRKQLLRRHLCFSVRSLPVSGIRESQTVSIEAGETGSASVAQVSPGYFSALGIPLLRGRAFSESDDERDSPVAVVDAGFARSIFGDRDPLGMSVAIGDPAGSRITIVGVVREVRQFGPRRPFEPTVYLPLLQSPRWSTFVAIRTGSSSPAGLSNALGNAVAAVDKNQLVTDVQAMAQRLDARTRRPRFSLVLFGAFGIVALVPAMVGVYPVELRYESPHKDHRNSIGAWGIPV